MKPLLNVDVVLYVNWLPDLAYLMAPDAGPLAVGALALDTALREDVVPYQGLCRLDAADAGFKRDFLGGVYAFAFTDVHVDEIVAFLDDIEWPDGARAMVVLRILGHGAVTLTYPRTVPDELAATEVEDVPELAEVALALVPSGERAPSEIPPGTWKRERAWSPPVV